MIWWPHPLALLTILFYFLGFFPVEFAPIQCVSLIPWFALLERLRTRKEILIQGLWISVGLALSLFHWVAYVLVEFGGLPLPVALLGLILFGLICQPQFVLLGGIRVWGLRHWKIAGCFVAPVVFALLYAGTDSLLPKLFVDTIGHSFYRTPGVRQLAELGGASLITFLVVLSNEAIWIAIKLRKYRWLAGTALLWLTALGYGLARESQIQDLQSHPKAWVPAAAIQGNIGDFDKVAAEQGVRGAADQVLSRFLELSDQALTLDPRPEFLVWPETSFPSLFRQPQTPAEQMQNHRVERFAHENHVTLLFGGYDRSRGRDHNAFFHLTPTGGPLHDLRIYRKHILLLFGEYLPGSETFPWLRRMFPQVANFGPGVGPEVIEVPTHVPGVPTLKTGPIICYEALFPNYVIAAARQGSQLINNITNDSWFGPWGEPQLHLALTVFRSIETRLPQLRTTNTGISALILPDGTVSQPTKSGEATILYVRIPVMDPIPTLMKRWGDYFPWLSLAIAAIVSAGVYFLDTGRRRNRRSPSRK